MTEIRLTTTSYAILGLLALGEWSTYELAMQMRRSLQHFWPRAESGIYEEPKRLVRAGLAEVDRTATGGRRRTVYRITPAGRTALQQWVESTPAAARSYASEPAVRIFLGDAGTTDALLRAVDDVAAAARATIASCSDVAAPYAAGRGRYPARLKVNALTLALAFDVAFAELEWAAAARLAIESWSDADRSTNEAALRDMLGRRLAIGAATLLSESGPA